MAEYTKKWLPVEEQLKKLESSGVAIPDQTAGIRLLRAVGYYRLTGYLYPFRESETCVNDEGRQRVKVLGTYRQGTTVDEAAALIDFDRSLRMLVLEGIERIEVSLRMQIGYTLGKESAFAHLDPNQFVSSFTDAQINPDTGEVRPSWHEVLVSRAQKRQNESDESFVAHFREKYDGRMPIWALTEIMELGQLGRMYGGLTNVLATKIAISYGVPSKKIMRSWVSSLNYVRNVAAHHARLFNRKLVASPRRPGMGQMPLLDHLKDGESSKRVFGLYNVLAIMAYLLRSIDPDCGWADRVVRLLEAFPESETLTISCMGVPAEWSTLELWQG
ncbi:Abi family protein [Paeniglutamicibacter gangotriensis]|uniref:Abi family protein n=2 Tax=Paeniglutamicibacter gangotriensis TaxID=254787 RepID=A0A5B0ECG3_9MICC|nr:Abi family protein [Paeniglutamicibacter gangotriensis]KAA0976543.1 Abi family protein [Paeniglutamicibacter gangotriensis]